MEEANLIYMDLKNKNSPLYNFLKAKNLMAIELNNNFPSKPKNQDLQFKPSIKAINILKQINEISKNIITTSKKAKPYFLSEETKTSRSINNEENKDILFNSFQNFIVFKKNEEFQKGVPILKLKQDEFDSKISYDRVKTKLVNMKNYQGRKYKKNKLILPELSVNIKQIFNTEKEPITKKISKNHMQKMNKSTEEKDITKVIPDYNTINQKKKYELYELNDWYYNNKKKPFKIK